MMLISFILCSIIYTTQNMPLSVGAVPSSRNDTDKPPTPKAICVMSRKIPDSEIIGVKFTKLTPVRFVGVHGTGRNAKRVFECLCECGTIKNVWLMSLMSGQTKSCGCHCMPYRALAIEKFGVYHSHLRTVHTTMLARCYNKKCGSYYNYGGRGITVCAEWKEDWFKFYCWAIANGWKRGLQIDRINNDQSYAPENCRIVTSKINGYNKRTSRKILYKNREYCLSELADLLNMPECRLRTRLNNGWSIDAAVSAPRHFRGFAHNNCHPIRQLDLEGNKIKDYKSISDAARENGLYASTIAKVVKGRFKTSGGFKWERI